MLINRFNTLIYFSKLLISISYMLDNKQLNTGIYTTYIYNNVTLR